MSNSTVIDTAALDAELAEKLFGLVPCDEYEPGNLGSAGGPVFYRRCNHGRDRCWNTKILPRDGQGGHFDAFGGLPAYSTTGDGLMQVLNCDPPEPWSLHWSIQQYRDGYYGPWWVGCSVTPGWSSHGNPYEWARHDDLPTAAALVLRQAWENKQERVTREERAAIEERNRPTARA